MKYIFISIIFFLGCVSVYAQKSCSSKPLSFHISSEGQLAVLNVVAGSVSFVDKDGNNVINANENCSIRFKVQNKGKGAAQNCEAKVRLAGATSGISVQTVKLPEIEPGQTYEVSIPIITDINTEDGEITFSVEVYEPNGWGVAPFDLVVSTRAFEAPLLKVADYKISSTSGEIHRMEPVTLSFHIQNIQYGNAEDVKVKINIPHDVYVLDGDKELSYGIIKPGEIKSYQLVLIINNNYIENFLPILIEIKEKYGKYGENKEIDSEIVQAEVPVTDITVKEENKRFRIVSDEGKTLTIVNEPRISMLANTSVSILKPEWFEKHHKVENVQSPFPYAAIKFELQGDKEAVELAKQRLSLTMGGKYIVEDKDDTETNTIWFLVHCRNEFIELDCGDGCGKITIWKERLEPNKVYYGTITLVKE